jgi:hypothetical protein
MNRVAEMITVAALALCAFAFVIEPAARFISVTLPAWQLEKGK